MKWVKKLKDNYWQLARTFAAYQKKLTSAKSSADNSKSLEAMTSAVTKMAEALEGSNSKSKASDVQTVTGLCPIQKIKVADANGVPLDILAMLHGYRFQYQSSF